MQEGKVITYEYRKLKDYEQNYSAYDLELTTIFHALNMWHHYLMGKKFLWKTDHHSLTSYFNQPTLNSRKLQWVCFLSAFNFNIKHLKGKENWLVNALSRKVNFLYKISCSEWRTTFIELIEKAVEKDQNYQQIGQQVLNPNNQEYQQG